MSVLGRIRRGHKSGAYTLVELMIVVTTVATLSTAALPTCSGNMKKAKMVEGIAACGSIRTAMRVYAVRHGGRYPDLGGVTGDQLQILGFREKDLDGKYFKAKDYVVNSTVDAYTVAATFDGMTYSLDQDGDEMGDFKTE